MSINNGVFAQLLLLQLLPSRNRFKSHSTPRPPHPASGFLLTVLSKARRALSPHALILECALPTKH